MIDQDPRRQQLRAAFTAEMEERVRALNDLLLKLERGGDEQPGRSPRGPRSWTASSARRTA